MLDYRIINKDNNSWDERWKSDGRDVINCITGDGFVKVRNEDVRWLRTVREEKVNSIKKGFESFHTDSLDFRNAEVMSPSPTPKPARGVVRLS